MGPLCINHTAQDESPEATVAWGIAECYKLFDIGCYLLSCESNGSALCALSYGCVTKRKISIST